MHGVTRFELLCSDIDVEGFPCPVCSAVFLYLLVPPRSAGCNEFALSSANARRWIDGRRKVKGGKQEQQQAVSADNVSMQCIAWTGRNIT